MYVHVEELHLGQQESPTSKRNTYARVVVGLYDQLREPRLNVFMVDAGRVPHQDYVSRSHRSIVQALYKSFEDEEMSVYTAFLRDQ